MAWERHGINPFRIPENKLKTENQIDQKPIQSLKTTTSYRAYVQQLVNSSNVVKSAEAHNGSKWHCVLKVRNSCEQKIVESTAVSQRQISRSSCTEISQKALRHMPDQRLLCTFIFSLKFSWPVVHAPS